VVTYDDLDALLALLPSLPGSLAAGVHAGDGDLEDAARVADTLSDRVGRLIFNGWPSGVAVCWAMHHGGPWPASAAPSTTRSQRV
jgi:NADP-dependent aldehyde dehydrogenase